MCVWSPHAGKYLDAYLRAASSGIREEIPLRTITNTPGLPAYRSSNDASGRVAHDVAVPGTRHRDGDWVSHGSAPPALRLLGKRAARWSTRSSRRALNQPRTTKLYDRTTDQVSLDEIERIAI